MKVTEYVFRKRDGSLRTLRGTVDFFAYAEKNPENWEKIKPKGIRKANPHNITLIDLDNGGWRSIRPDTIIARRDVQPFAGGYHIHEYKKMTLSEIMKDTSKKTFIKRNNVPYYALMVLNSAPLIKRNDVEVIVEGMMEKLGRNLTVRDGHIRAFSRAFRKFANNGLVEKLGRKGDYYKITDKGREVMASGVRL